MKPIKLSINLSQWELVPYKIVFNKDRYFYFLCFTIQLRYKKYD